MLHKRLVVKLPSDHPIFSLPRGARMAWVRQALDMSESMMQMESRLNARLSAMEARLTGIPAPDPGSPEPAGPEKPKTARVDVDVDTFFARFD